MGDQLHTPGKNAHGTQWMGGCVGPEVSPDAVAKIRIKHNLAAR